MNDLLDEAFLAMREERPAAAVEAARTRRRILLEATARRRARTTAARVVVPLVAILAATTAFAASGRIFRTLPASVHEIVPRAPRSAGAPAPAPAPSTTTTTTTTITIEALPDAPPVPSVARPRRTAPPPPSPPPRSDEDDLYAAAHHAHFVAREPARALAAWDAYLAKHPNGKLAPEARYNRAIALVRLGRVAEARAALTPFAEGRFGGYRQDEARALLDSFE